MISSKIPTSAYSIAGIRASDKSVSKRSKWTKNNYVDRLDELKFSVCDFYHISFEEFMSHKREMELVLVRKVFAFIAYQYCEVPLCKVAKYMNRDHTSVIYYLHKVKDLMDTEPVRAKEIQYLSAKVFA